MIPQDRRFAEELFGVRKRFTRDRMRKTIALCRGCHGTIHRVVPDEKALARQHNTIESLLEHPEIAKFVAWASQRR